MIRLGRTWANSSNSFVHNEIKIFIQLIFSVQDAMGRR